MTCHSNSGIELISLSSSKKKDVPIEVLGAGNWIAPAGSNLEQLLIVLLKTSSAKLISLVKAVVEQRQRPGCDEQCRHSTSRQG
jgi:hypothetical protein